MYSQGTYDRAIDLRRAGLTYKEISSRTGVSESQVLKWCNQEGVSPIGVSYVYFVYAEAVARCKIGYAKDVKGRANNINTSSPVPVELLGSIRTSQPQKMERKIHEQNYDRLVKGEWFSIEKDEAIKIIKSHDGGQGVDGQCQPAAKEYGHTLAAPSGIAPQ